MFILNPSPTPVTLQTQYSNDEFLALQLWQMDNLFKDEIRAIKNINLEFIALSPEFIDAFCLTEKCTVEDDKIKMNEERLFTPEILTQEKELLNNLGPQNSMLFFKRKGELFLTPFAMRRRPIINPTTKDLLGILIVSIKCKIGFFRKSIIKQLDINLKTTPELENSLTEQQQQIALCLLMGYISHKEIADIVSQINNQDINEIRIKNQLKYLYDKFSCSTPAQLTSLISVGQSNIELSINTVLEGNYPF